MKIIKQKQRNIFLLATLLSLSSSVIAVPVVPSNLPLSADYSITNQSEATLTLSEDKQVVEFDNGFSINPGETFNVLHNGGNSNWKVLVKDTSENPSSIIGTLNGNMGLFLINKYGINFSSNSVSLEDFVASTLDINNDEFSSGSTYTFEHDPAVISSGIQVFSFNSQKTLTLISNKIDFYGDANVNDGDINMAVGKTVLLSYGSNNLIQFDVTEALDSDGGILTVPNTELSAQDINAISLINDPQSVAINNLGIITARGIDIDDSGTVRLISNAITSSIGGVEAGDAINNRGNLIVEADQVYLGGQIDSKDISISIGNESSHGTIVIFPNLSSDAESMDIVGLAPMNTAIGLANVMVTGLNSGSASLEGIGITDDNLSERAVNFSNIPNLVLSNLTTNEVVVTDNGQLYSDYNGSVLGGLSAGGQGDNFEINGSVVDVTLDGFDNITVTGSGSIESISGASAAIVVSGSGSIGTINAPTESIVVSGSGTIGSVDSPSASIFVSGSGSIGSVNVSSAENITISPDLDVEIINVGEGALPFIDISSGASLGIVSGGDNINLPCDFRLDTEACESQQILTSSFIYFNFDSSSISSSDTQLLKEISTLFIEESDFNAINLSGHTDNVGTEKYNLALSKRRVDAVANYLSGLGVDKRLFKKTYYGESSPLMDNNIESGRAINRRVHIELE